MIDDVFEPAWPVREGRERDLYFYLQALETYGPEGLVRVTGHGEMKMFGSYSYLGLNRHPAIDEASRRAIDRYGTGTHGVRLLAGTLDLHRSLEARVARFKGTEAAVSFSSGFLANLSTIACLVGRGDTVICDKLDHVSIVDGCRLTRARFLRFRHADMAQLEDCLRRASPGGRKLVVVDAVFSMDGDVVNLPEVSRLCKEHGALLMVDEAHSIGVLGRTGHGVEEHFGLPPETVDVKMGTFSKAIPSMGGYVCGSERLCEFLSHHARGFIYSGALSPAAAAAAEAALDVIEAEPERVAKLHENTRYLGRSLRDTGFDVPERTTPIFPIVCGDDWQAWRLARHCQKRGIYVQAIPYPVVPKGTARLRLTVTAEHEREDIDRCVSILRDGALEVGGILDRKVG